jgi:hypothetical protein
VVDVRSADVNAYIKEVAGERFSAKDFRTWSATVAAAAQLAAVMVERRLAVSPQAPGGPGGQRGGRAAGRHANGVPGVLVDPRVIERFHGGECINVQIGRLDQGGVSPDLVKTRHAIETAVIDLLSEVAAVA